MWWPFPPNQSKKDRTVTETRLPNLKDYSDDILKEHLSKEDNRREYLVV
jgi:hypothetical protein